MFIVCLHLELVIDTEWLLHHSQIFYNCSDTNSDRIHQSHIQPVKGVKSQSTTNRRSTTPANMFGLRFCSGKVCIPGSLHILCHLSALYETLWMLKKKVELFPLPSSRCSIDAFCEASLYQKMLYISINFLPFYVSLLCTEVNSCCRCGGGWEQEDPKLSVEVRKFRTIIILLSWLFLHLRGQFRLLNRSVDEFTQSAEGYPCVCTVSHRDTILYPGASSTRAAVDLRLDSWPGLVS